MVGMSRRGLFILLEGTDGSGKATQAKLLAQTLRRVGRKVMMVDFPQYGKPSAWFVEQYLNGEFGKASDINPYEASLFYALDRAEAGPRIKKALAQGKIVIANRYTLSNAAHQGGKISNAREQKKYWQWLFNLEYHLLKLPQPKVTIILHVPAKISQTLVDKKSVRSYIKGKKRDAHEADILHLQHAEQAYLKLSKIYGFKVVEGIHHGRLLPPPEIHAKVWKIVTKN